MTPTIRIAKFLSAAGAGSRRRCEEFIAQGRVRVNGTVVTSPGDRVDPEKDRVELDGRGLGLTAEKQTIMVHKPPGYVTTCSDPRGRPIVLDLLPGDVRSLGLYPVGRLDKDTEGLLLLTNDGDLAYRLTHPRFGVEKTYRVRVKGSLTGEAAERLETGVVLGERKTAPARIVRIEPGPKETELDLVIHEGRKRQVRRMMLAVGHRVTRLIRTRLGPLDLGELPSGSWRFLEGEELAALKSACGLVDEESGTGEFP
jgi:23S rRNA pseudouridine2605 synthase